MRLKNHIRKRLIYYYSTTCDCSRHYQRTFEPNFSVIAWFHSACKENQSTQRFESCPPEIEIWQSGEKLARYPVPKTAREFDDILKMHEIVRQDLKVEEMI